MSSPQKFLFTGGGSGGHVAPALAIAEAIRANHPTATFRYVGVKGKAEESMVPRAWAEDMQAKRASLTFVRSRGFPGIGKKLPLFAIDLAMGMVKSFFILLSFQPKAIIATGGYVAAPILLTAFVMRKLGLFRGKIFVHEQNAVLGRMNALAVRFSDRVGLAFSETKVPAAKKAFVGYPVRKAVAVSRDQDEAALRTAARESLQLPQDAKVLFAFGGSQGARTINRGIVDALPLLLADPKVVVIHGTGKKLKGNSYNGMSDVQARLKTLSGLPDDWESRYRPQDFFHNMGAYYSAADVVVCRGGAGSLNEVCANGVAAIVIPKANLPGDHQAHNARSIERMNAVRVIYERVDLASGAAVESVSGEELSELAFSLLNNPDLRAEMIASSVGIYNPQTTAMCAGIIDFLLGLGEMPTLLDPTPQKQERVLGLNSNGLIALLTRCHRGQDSLTEDERRLALYKIDGYLAASSYVQNARACRMIGLGGYVERKDALVAFGAGKRHGSYSKLPIARRDAFVGMKLLGDVSPEVLDALGEGMTDPYFEARVCALQALTALARQSANVDGFQSFIPTLITLSTHKAFDTRAYALIALSEMVRDFSLIEQAIVDRRYDTHWKVRQQLLNALVRLAARGIISEKKAAEEGSDVLLTSDGYRMIFPIKEAFNELPGRSAEER